MEWLALKEATMLITDPTADLHRSKPWNKGLVVGQKRRLEPRDVWTIRARLQLQGCMRDANVRP
jgi:hypothetical protein